MVRLEFDPLDFLSLAKSFMQSQPTNEALIRTAVSRGYYSVFLKGRERIKVRLPGFLETLPRLSDQHIGVIRGLKRLRRFGAADKLYLLKQLRTTADYELRPALRATDGQRAMDLAEDILSLLP